MNTVLTQVLKEFVSESWYFPQIRVVDAVEILIITFLFYQIILWIKNTKAWMLLRFSTHDLPKAGALYIPQK